MLTRKRVLAAAIEASVGTAETLDATDAAMNIMDAIIQPNIAMTPRMEQGGFGHNEAVPEGYGATITFRTELTGDGSGGITVPVWADTFLPACGWVKTGSTFAPVTSPPGSNGVETLTIGVYKDGRLETAKGCMGTFTLNFPSGRMAFIEWTFTGLWVTPSDTAILTPTYPTDLPLRAANSTFTIGAWSPCIEALTIEAGNNVILRECSNVVEGYASALVADRLITGTLNPEATLVATNDTHADWVSMTEKAFSYSLTDGTDTLTFSSSNFQIVNVQDEDRGGNQVDAVSFQLNQDDLSIAFS
jgi:hypothetical protein